MLLFWAISCGASSYFGKLSHGVTSNFAPPPPPPSCLHENLAWSILAFWLDLLRGASSQFGLAFLFLRFLASWLLGFLVPRPRGRCSFWPGGFWPPWLDFYSFPYRGLPASDCLAPCLLWLPSFFLVVRDLCNLSWTWEIWHHLRHLNLNCCHSRNLAYGGWCRVSFFHRRSMIEPSRT